MNAQSKNLTRIAAALVLAMACGNTWAAGNSITFEGASRSTGNGTNNVGNIDANTGTAIDVSIRQINDPTVARDVETASKMNQVGDYVGGTAISIGGTAKVRIGQGVKFDGTGEAFDNATEANSKNNLVKGSITGTSQAYISQTGAGTGGQRLANVTMTGGTLKANQTADDQQLTVTSMTGGNLNTQQDASGQRTTVTSMTGGTLNVNQKSTATNSTVNITRFTGGSTTINQGQIGGTGDTGAESTLTLDSGADAKAALYTNVKINQNGSYQQGTVTYVNGGYSGDLNLGAKGDAGGGTPVYATVDVKM